MIRSSYFDRLEPRSPTIGTSPIAADGGFGPMNNEYEEEEEEDDDDDDNEVERRFNDQNETMELHTDHHESSPENDDESMGDEFDDFEEGAAIDDFGDFDDGAQTLGNVEEDVEPASTKQVPHMPSNPFVSSRTLMYKIALFRYCSYTKYIDQRLICTATLVPC